MKKERFVRFSVLAIMAMMTVCMFTACGDDDDSSDSGTSNIGIHRIDVQFSDNAAGCEVTTIFYGLKQDGSFAALYEKGKSLSLEPSTHTWMTEDVRDISVQTEDGCGALSASITIMGPNMNNVSSDVTVTVVGYVNNKRIKTQVFTLPAGKHIMGGGFVTEDTKTYPEAVE